MQFAKGMRRLPEGSFATNTRAASIGSPSAEQDLQTTLGQAPEIIDTDQSSIETFVYPGQLRKLAEPAFPLNAKRIPGLKLDHPGNWR